ncbi:MAG: tellurium resistance protein [Frankiales bacterium]|jgi:tellurite resistance protein TerA|nr:tellurium resistance protein [Frankiales bacterium]
MAVSLDKITLTKAAPAVSLTKKTGASGQLRVNLNWNAGKGGGLFKKSSAIDLDLGCLFELRDGSKGVVQALGNAFGSTTQPPYVMLDGDDRSGSGSGGENLLINLEHLDKIKRILVFAYIYEGVPAWNKADGVVTLFPQGGQAIEVLLDEGSGARSCAIALLESNGEELSIRREVRYIEGAQRQLDEAYGWGMNWSAGKK